jgi:hypothetical protein
MYEIAINRKWDGRNNLHGINLLAIGKVHNYEYNDTLSLLFYHYMDFMLLIESTPLLSRRYNCGNFLSILSLRMGTLPFAL